MLQHFLRGQRLGLLTNQTGVLSTTHRAPRRCVLWY